MVRLHVSSSTDQCLSVFHRCQSEERLRWPDRWCYPAKADCKKKNGEHFGPRNISSKLTGVFVVSLKLFGIFWCFLHSLDSCSLRSSSLLVFVFIVLLRFLWMLHLSEMVDWLEKQTHIFSHVVEKKALLRFIPPTIIISLIIHVLLQSLTAFSIYTDN